MNSWLAYAFLTVVTWGFYALFLHEGSMALSTGNIAIARQKAFLFVGVAYLIVAILGPLLVLWLNGATWDFKPRGIGLSLFAGTLGAVGAFGVLMALGAKGSSPTVVMSIVFAGAPVVNAIAAMFMHPPEGGWTKVDPRFYVGIVVAAVGGCLVAYYKPAPAKKIAPGPVAQVQHPSPGPHRCEPAPELWADRSTHARSSTPRQPLSVVPGSRASTAR